MIHIAPSILAADFSRLGEEVAATERAGAQRVHVDVMDGHFVPNLSMGACVVQGLRPRTKLPIEVHLMVEDPARYFAGFVKAGCDSLIVHHEVLADPRPVFEKIRQAGKKVGFAVNPEHPVEALADYLPEIDLALCMTVHPGFGGQQFLPDSPQRIRRLRELIEKKNPRCELEVDGGIDVHNTATVVSAGANVLVVGTGIFRYKDGPAAALAALQCEAQAATST
jgi:ribulose-phosphate 3-epimerase